MYHNVSDKSRIGSTRFCAVHALTEYEVEVDRSFPPSSRHDTDVKTGGMSYIHVPTEFKPPQVWCRHDLTVVRYGAQSTSLFS